MINFPKLVKRMIFYDRILLIYKKVRAKQILRDWVTDGKPIPAPHIIKQKAIKEYAKKYSIDTFVETGTYLGEMVDATKNTFKQIISIELSQDLYVRAKKRFRKYKNITIICGDSGELMPLILTNIAQPCLFWLDGHYSEGVTAKGLLDTPIRQELQHILQHNIKGHVILIDDARCFVGQNDYPAIEELRELVLKINPDLEFEVKDDIIRIFNANKSPNSGNLLEKLNEGQITKKN